MPKLLPGSPFTCYDFSQSELVIASCFSDEQTQWLQTQVAGVAMKLIVMEPNGLNDQQFMLDRQRLIGMKDAYEALILHSENKKAEILQRTVDSAFSNAR